MLQGLPDTNAEELPCMFVQGMIHDDSSISWSIPRVWTILFVSLIYSLTSLPTVPGVLFAREARPFEQFSDQDAEPDFNLVHP